MSERKLELQTDAIMHAAVRQILRDLKKGEVQRNKFAQPPLRFLQTVSSETADTNSDEKTVTEEKKKKQFVSLRLPWMPEDSFAPLLLAAVRVVSTVEQMPDKEAVFQPSTLTVLYGAGSDCDDDGVITAISETFELLKSKSPNVDHRKCEVIVRLALSRSGSNAASQSSVKHHVTQVQRALRRGMAVILVVRDRSSVDPELQPLVDHSAVLKPCDRLGLAEIARCVHRECTSMSVEELLNLLPDDKVIAQLTSTQIEVGLRQLSLPAMLEKWTRHLASSVKKLGVTLGDVHGQPRAVSAFKAIIDDLERWKAGEIEWSDVASSAIMYGPPGNGKTLLAEAVAGSARLPFVSTSYAACQRMGHQGDMLKALNAAFESAITQSPAVLFIDEIDSFSQRGSGENDGYMRGVVNGLLTELSRAVETPGLILIGATNHLSVVDPAVIRPGRFDLRIHVGNPTMDGILGILCKNLGRTVLDGCEAAAFKEVSRNMVGMSGAAVAAKSREALGLARAHKRQVTPEDLRRVLHDVSIQDHKFLWRMATHETGHLLVHVLSGGEIPKYVAVGGQGGFVEFAATPLHTEETAETKLRVLMAGRVAEHILLGDISSGSGHGEDSDLALATKLAIRMESEWCLSSNSLLWSAADDVMKKGLPPIMREHVMSRLKQAEHEALTMLQENCKALDSIAKHLLEVRELQGEDLQEILQRALSAKSMCAA